MNNHTKNFLEAILFSTANNPSEPNIYLDGKTADDFSQVFIDSVTGFIEGFEDYLVLAGFDIDRINNLSRSFGANIYYSLSGNGCGFFDEYNSNDQTLGSDLNEALFFYSKNPLRFWELDYSLWTGDDGKIDLAFVKEHLDELRKNMFTAN